jgi:single-strand DNA-binding protein
MKATQNGQNICTFGVATNREWVTGGGEKKKSTEFHEIVAWSRLADICSKFLKKGKLVYLEGYLKRRSWDAENGEKKFKTEIVLEDMIILSRKPNEEDVDLPVYESSEPLSDDIGENIF